jgi:arginyl-tRNA synthetase
VTSPLAELRAAVMRTSAMLVDGAAGDAPAEPRVERPKRAGQGDYATNVAMLLAPVLGAPPREIAERAGAVLGDLLGPELIRFEVAGPGFLNLFLSDDWHRRALRMVLDAGSWWNSCRPTQPVRWWRPAVATPPTAMR